MTIKRPRKRTYFGMTGGQVGILTGFSVLVFAVLIVGVLLLLDEPVISQAAQITTQPTQAVPATTISRAKPTYPPTWTSTPAATATPAASPTPKPPTETPTPKNTPTPTPTATPKFRPQTQKIGPIMDSLSDSTYSVAITLKGVEWLTEDQYDKPKLGNVYVVADLEVKNIGPGELRSMGIFNFQIKDAKGAVRDYTMLSSFYNTCQMETVDLVAGGSSDGCVTFEVPATGKIELIYAPFKYDGLTSGRYISFVLRGK
jgi:hypothetical protein